MNGTSINLQILNTFATHRYGGDVYGLSIKLFIKLVSMVSCFLLVCVCDFYFNNYESFSYVGGGGGGGGGGG